MTSIVILSYNTLSYTRACIESIRAHTESYEIIVVENGSQDGSRAYLEAQADVRCIFNAENAGFPRGCNQGLAVARGEELLLLNSDVIVTPHWLENLRIALWSSPEVGAASCVTNSCANCQQVAAPYRDMEELARFSARFNRSDPALWEDRLRLTMFCFLFKREVYERLGGLDERFSPGNFEDDDYSLRILKAGGRLLLCGDTFVHHFGHTSFLKARNDAEGEEKRRKMRALLDVNQKKLMEKHRIPADYYFRDAYALFPRLAEKLCNADIVTPQKFVDRKRAAEVRARRDAIHVAMVLSGGCAPSFFSFLEAAYTERSHPVKVHLLHSHALPQGDRERIAGIARAHAQSVCFYDGDMLGAELLQAVDVPRALEIDRLSAETLYFLMLPAILSKQVEYVLYLDGRAALKDLDFTWESTEGVDTVAARAQMRALSEESAMVREGILKRENLFSTSVMLLHLSYVRRWFDFLADGLYFFAKYPQAEGSMDDMMQYFFQQNVTELAGL